MNLSLLEGRLAGIESNDFEPSLEVEQGRCCVVLRPSAQREPVRTNRRVQPAVAQREQGQASNRSDQARHAGSVSVPSERPARVGENVD